MFYGREKEMKLLSDRYDSGKFEFIPLYGRRRVGKTALLREFMKGRNGAFFTATADGEAKNMSRLASKVFGIDGIRASLDSILEEVRRRSADERYVLVIDEYPKLLRKMPGASDTIQNFIDEIHDDSKLFLILCGSSLSIMEHQVLGYSSPLYGRRTGSLKLNPLDLWDSMDMLDGFDRDDAVRIYGMVGGIPLYLKQFDPSKDMRTNIMDTFLRQDSYFRNEHDLMLIEEFESPDTYRSILMSVSSGNTKVSEITMDSGIDGPTVTKHLKSLMKIGIVAKDRPVDNPSGKKTMYRLSDPFMRFQFGCVLPLAEDAYDDEIEGLSDDILERFETKMGFAFEGMCSEYLCRLHHGVAGKWWGSDPDAKTMEEIDLIVTRKVDGRKVGWFAECKFRGEPVGKDVLETLSRRMDLVKGYHERRPVLFSRSGFTSAVSETDGLELYTLDDILRRP